MESTLVDNIDVMVATLEEADGPEKVHATRAD